MNLRWKKVFLLLSCGFIVFLMMPFHSDNIVLGHYSDPYYVCNFVEYDNGDQWINQTDNGLLWLQCSPVGITGLPQVHTRDFYKGYMFAEVSNMAGAPGDGWLNFTGPADYIEYFLYTATSNSGQWSFNMSFFEDDVLKFYVLANDVNGATYDNNIYVYYADGTLFGSDTVTDSARKQLNMTFNLTTGEANIDIWNTTISGWGDFNITSGITSIFCDETTTNFLRTIMVDDIKVTLEGEEGSYIDCDDVVGFETIGKKTSDDMSFQRKKHGTLHYRTLEARYYNKVTTSIHCIDLMVDHNSYKDIDWSLINSYINGNFFSKAKCLEQYTAYDGRVFSYLRFYRNDFSGRTVTDEKIVFEFYNGGPAHTPGGENCYWSILTDFTDHNSDGFLGVAFNTQRQNGVYDGEMYGDRGEPLIQWWHSGFSVPGEDCSDYTDTLDVHGHNGIYDYNGEQIKRYTLYDTVFHDWTTSNLALGTSIRIYNITGGTSDPPEVGEVYGFGTGNLLVQCAGTKGFPLFNTGTFESVMFRNGNNISGTAVRWHVQDYDNSNGTFVLLSYPNPSFKGETYSVYYKYVHPEGFKGAWGVGDDNLPNDLTECDIWEQIFSGSEGWFSYQDILDAHNIDNYWRFFVFLENGTVSYPIGRTHIHYLQGWETFSLFLDVGATNKVDTSEVGEQIGVRFSHYFYDQVLIKANGIVIHGTTEPQKATIQYIHYDEEYVNFTMEVLINNNWTLLDWEGHIFSVDADDVITEGEEYQIILGIAICFGFAGFISFTLGSFIAFPFVAGVFAWVLSMPIGGYQLFPGDFAIGLVVLMALFAVVAWLVR